MAEQRYPGATWKPGPTAKIGYSAFGTSGPKRGIVPHSAEGWAANIMPIINDLGRRASWHFTILLDGTAWQHYEVEAHCWHAGDVGDDGGVRANIDLVGIEHEGIAGTRITDAQVDALAKLYRWLQAEHGFGPYETRVTVYEHNWVSDEPTACPSGRIRHSDVKAKITQLEEADIPNDVEEDDDMPFLTFHCTPPPGKGYKRWFLEGGRKHWLASAEDVTALEAAGVISAPVTLTVAQVKAFPGRPNPEDW